MDLEGFEVSSAQVVDLEEGSEVSSAKVDLIEGFEVSLAQVDMVEGSEVSSHGVPDPGWNPLHLVDGAKDGVWFGHYPRNDSHPAHGEWI
ncbi:hypothetical protein TNCV_3285941 [Trichonephila clavipes]|nr:hypothetical protein TNCV_3285941 [Trichonephila clavipes]